MPDTHLESFRVGFMLGASHMLMDWEAPGSATADAAMVEDRVKAWAFVVSLSNRLALPLQPKMTALH